MAADADKQAPRGDNAPSLSEIIEVILPQVERIEQGFTAIRVTLDALASHVSGSATASSATREPVQPPPAANIPTAEPVPVPAASPLPQPAATSPPRATPVTAAVPAGNSATPELPPTAGPASQARIERPGRIAVSGSDGGNWSRILFGENLQADPTISHLSGTLLADVYAGDNGAIGLAGQLMTFRTGTAEQRARLLKDVGEAFYGWRPRGDESLLEPLITWVHAELDAVDLGNRITVVQVGDRYDMQRHNAKQPGVEVAEVYGWVVLRDNGKVFSKANVAVK